MRTRRSLAVLAVTALLGAACGSGTDDGDDGIEAAGPTATPAPTVTPRPTPDVTPTAPIAEPPALLVAHDGGVDVLTHDDVLTLLAGQPVAVALADHRGGLVVQFAEEGPATIAWIPAVGDEPVMLDTDPEARWRSLQQVALVDGAPTALYAEAVELPNECGSDEECRWDFQRTLLMAHGLADGRRLVLGTVGSFESGAVSYTIGPEWTVLEATPYGSPASCVGVLPTAELVGAPSAERWIGYGSDLGSTVVAWPLTGPCAGEQVEVCGDDFCEVHLSAAIAPAGDTAAVAWAQRSAAMVDQNVPLAPALVTVATDGGAELDRLELGGDEAVPTWIDFDGTWTVVGRAEYGTGVAMAPLLVGPDGVVTELAVDGYACAAEGCPRLAIWSPPAS